MIDGQDADPAPFNETHATNVASGDARVGVQADSIENYINRADVIHIGATIYQPSDDSPRQKFEVARRLLEIGGRTEAAARIRDLVTIGEASAEVAYYWALAVLSGRPYEHLDDEDIQNLQHAYDVAEKDEQEPGPWRDALAVVRRLLDHLVAQEEQGAQPGMARLDGWFTALEALPANRYDEIMHHLEPILTRMDLEREDVQRAEWLRAHRMANSRRERVPKFFHPDPAKARKLGAEPPDVGLVEWVMFVGGIAIFGAGTVLALGVLAGVSLAVTTAVALLCGSGGMAVTRFGPEHRYLAWRREDRERQIGVPSAGRPDPPAGPGPKAIEKFATEITGLVERRFANVKVEPVDERRFAADVAGLRAGLRDDIVDLYGHDTTSVRPASVDWLIRWHAEQTALTWQSRALYEFRNRRRLPRRAGLLLAAGVAALSLGAVLGVVVMVRASAVNALGATALLGFGGRLLVAAGLTIYTEGRRYQDDTADHARRYEQECAAYQVEWDYLANRPTDTEMARWLDWDKEYLTLAAMKRYELTAGQVIARFVLTEAARDCGRARVLFGPWRYSAYQVRVFLLTSNGVRQVELHLNFVNGAENSERRTTFRYDAIASVRINETSVRGHGRRQVATPDGGGPGSGLPMPVLGQTMRLTLVNGRPINIKADYDSLLPEAREDAQVLRQLAQDTSGVVTALRFLESVAAEGREWASRRRPG